MDCARWLKSKQRGIQTLQLHTSYKLVKAIHHNTMDTLKDIDPRTIDPTKLDPRISYDTVEEKWIFEDPENPNDGHEYNTTLGQWIPLDLVNENNMTDAQKEILQKKKQKIQEMKKLKEKGPQTERKRQNTAVYVSGLPLDCDVIELRQVFSKYGVISEDLLTGKARIKMYTDDEGKFKGDALVIYMKPESVPLAVQMLDDTRLRVGADAIKVQAAEFKEKVKQENSNDESQGTKRQLTDEDKKVIKKKLKQMSDRVEDWHGDDEAINPKWLRTMVLRRAFTLQELSEDPQEKIDIAEDIKEGCEDFGNVEKVILFDQEEDGVVLVRFVDAESASKCIEKMDGRFFGGRKLMATRYNGEHFNRTESATTHRKDESTHALEDTKHDSERLESYIADVSEE
ncbi:Splicing factor U2AF-associated protein 2 [Cyberlindnera fabianii]|uniref:Splicing factor U2AF-associated protein 2 n=1 Tax=Cyberlindnera fabianii TaxID=36022 RepID=A0A1V2LDE1_CYBFA|nr:Splicing factor U2AF-associated protein 2 [Cyberlindnera fabianii]